MDEIMTEEEVAAYLKMNNPEEIKDWIKKRLIPFHEKLGMIRFFKTEIDSWFKSKSVGHRRSLKIKGDVSIRDKWRKFFEDHVIKKSELMEKKGNIYTLKEETVRVQFSKFYENGFNGKDAYWFDIPETFFDSDEIKTLYFVCQKAKDKEEFVIFKIPKLKLNREHFDRAKPGGNKCRRLHITADENDNYRELRNKKHFEFIDFKKKVH